MNEDNNCRRQRNEAVLIFFFFSLAESPDMKKEQDHPTKPHTKKHSKLAGFRCLPAVLFVQVEGCWRLPVLRQTLPLPAACISSPQTGWGVEREASLAGQATPLQWFLKVEFQWIFPPHSVLFVLTLRPLWMGTSYRHVVGYLPFSRRKKKKGGVRRNVGRGIFFFFFSFFFCWVLASFFCWVTVPRNIVYS